MSLFFPDPCVNASVPISLSFTSASVSVALCVATVIGNLLVVLAVIIDPNGELKRSPFNYFVANLAACDLIVGVITDPMSVEYHIREVMRLRRYRDQKVEHMAFFISCTGSLLSLAALAVDRLTAIISPLAYRAKLTYNRVAIASVCIWLFSLSFPFIYFKVGYIAFSFVFVNTAVVLTFIVLLVTSLKISQNLRRQILRWSDLSENSSTANGPRLQAEKREQVMTRAFVLMLAVFIASFLPACVFSYLLNLCRVCSCSLIHWSRDLVILFALTNSAVNPYLYAWRLQAFRSAFGKILLCQYGKTRDVTGETTTRTCTTTTSLPPWLNISFLCFCVDLPKSCAKRTQDFRTLPFLKRI